jgi:hypothetical protein
MTAQIIEFPCKRFFVQRYNFEEPFDEVIVPLKARDEHSAILEGDDVGEACNWEGWFIYDNDNQLVQRVLD